MQLKSCVFRDWFFLRQFAFWVIVTFNLQWCRARDFFGSQIPMTTASNCAKETLLRSVEFEIKINIERETIAVWNLARSCEVTQYLISSIFNFLKNFFFSYFFLKSATAALICTFHLPYLFVYIFFSTCGNKLQDFCSIKYILRRIFFPCRQFATLNSRDILIVEFSWYLIHVAFPLKVA